MLPAAYRSIFQVRPFRLFWLGFTFSVLGDALTRVAFTWFVYDLTKSPQALGILTLCYSGPIILGGLMAGWLLDRFNRRTVMIVDNVVRGAAVGLIPLLFALGQLQLWHIYLVAAVYGLFMMIGLAGGPSYIPDLVRQEHLEAANALETLSYTIGGVIGPAIAGLLISVIGAPNVVLIDALSYFAFALLLFQIPSSRGQSSSSTHQRDQYRLSDAFYLMLRNPILLSTTLMYLLANIGSGGLVSVWLPILADTVLGGGAGLFGLLLGVVAVGEVISAFIAGSVKLPFSTGTRICIAQVLTGLSLALLLIVPTHFGALLSMFLVGFFSAPLTIWAQTLRMEIIPQGLRGRTFALLRTLMQSGNPLGGALAGWLLPLTSIPLMIGLSAALVSIPGLFGYAVKALRAAGRDK